MKGNLKKVIIYLLVFSFFVFAAYYLLGDSGEKVTYKDIVTYFHNIKSDDENAISVKEFVLDDQNKLTILLSNGDKISYTIQDRNRFYQDCYNDYVFDENGDALIDFDIKEPTTYPAWLSLLPYIIVIVAILALFIYVFREASGGKGSKINNFGRARAKVSISGDKNKVRFADVAGEDEEKQELQEVVDFLKDPTKFTKLGAKIPHGVLLMGPPGTGKTLLAKAVAGEAGVPFYSISGSDFVEMYVGVGASRVRDLFETARKNPASIIFIDEIDAVGRHRGAGLGGGHDEREQTLNQLLVEMDGFSGNEGIIVMAATNRPDILDPALLRPGRFDRQITVNYPDLRGRVEILKVHSKDKPFEKDVDLEVIARGTPGFTGADLANLLNEAALLAARRGKSLIGMNDIEDSQMKIMVGTQKKTLHISDEEKYKTAIHEAGHAVVRHLLPGLDPVHQISIIPSGRALGYTLYLPDDDKTSEYKNELKSEIASLLAGRVAEAVFFNDISGGASNDIKRATEIARKMVTQLGMSDKLGPIQFGSGHTEVFLGRELSDEQNYSEKTASLIDEEIHGIISNAYSVAENIINEHKGKLESIAKFLIKNETMDENQFNALMDNDPEPTMEELEAMMDEKRKKSIAENKAEEERKKREAELKKAEEEQRMREAASSDFGQPSDSSDSNDGDNSGDDTAKSEENRDSGNYDNNFFSDR